jgi:SAM-dependent methyltransferase
VRRRYEEHWREIGDPGEPWRWAWRRELLLGELRPGDRWLDLGCGAGRFTALAPGAIGVDVAETALERAREHVPAGDFRLVDADGTLPLGHGEVDLVWCSETIEHVADALGLLEECRRVLAPGGRLLLTTPGHPLARRVAIAALRFDAHFDPLGQHLRFFTKRSLARAMDQAGLPGSVTGGAVLVGRAVR